MKIFYSKFGIVELDEVIYILKEEGTNYDGNPFYRLIFGFKNGKSARWDSEIKKERDEILDKIRFHENLEELL